MSNEWSTQRARRVRVSAAPGMHVANPGIQLLLRFPCASLHSLFLSQVKEKSACACLLSP